MAFVQGGVDSRPQASDSSDDEDLMSLGSLFYEPVWLFYREDAALRLLKSATLTSLAPNSGAKISICCWLLSRAGASTAERHGTSSSSATAAAAAAVSAVRALR